MQKKFFPITAVSLTALSFSIAETTSAPGCLNPAQTSFINDTPVTSHAGFQEPGFNVASWKLTDGPC